MHEAMKRALAIAGKNSSWMVQQGTKESYNDPKHQNQLKRGGKVHADAKQDKKLIKKEIKKALKK